MRPRLGHEERVARAGRYGGGPARLLADVPQLGFVVIALLLLVNLAIVGQRVEDRRTASSVVQPVPVIVPPTGPAELDIFGTAQTGPLPGTAVAPYLVRRQAELARRVRREPGALAAAVVSFSAAEKPAAAVRLLAGRPVLAVCLRVQVRGKITDAGVLPVKGALAPALAKGIAAITASLSADAAANTHQGDTTTNTEIPVNAAQKQAFYAEAATENAEIAVLKVGGPAIYGAVVSGSYADLGRLAALPDVRLVDPADDPAQPAAIVPHALAPDDLSTVASLETLRGLRAP